MLQALKLEVNQFGRVEELHGHIRYALSLGLPEFTPALCPNDGTFVVVGSGPSLPSTYEGLREERAKGRPICSVKGTHDFLIQRGIEPDLFFTIDPRPRVDQISCKSPNTIYVISSRCHPDMFKRLKDDNLILCHTYAEQDDADAIFEERDSKANGLKTFLLGGGTTSGTRAMILGYAMGFRKFVLYGMDSCLGPDRKTKRFNGDQAGLISDIRVGKYDGDTEEVDPNARVFYTNQAMAQQAKDFERLYHEIPGITVESKGDGLLTAIIQQRKDMGLPS